MTFASDHDRNAEIKALQRDLLEIAYELAAFKFVRLLAQREAKYNPNWPSQPRVPAGYGRQSGRWSGPHNSLVGPNASGLLEPSAEPPSPPKDPRLGRLVLNALSRSWWRLPLELSGDTPQPIETPYFVPGADDLLLVHVERPATLTEVAYFARVVEPEHDFQPFALAPRFRIPAKVKRLDVPVEFVDGEALFDPAELERAYGKKISGVVAGNKPGRGGFRITPGSGVETLNGEEAALAATMRAQGRGTQEIQAEIDARRSSKPNKVAPPIFSRSPPSGSPAGTLSYKVGENEIVLTPRSGRNGPYDVDFVIRKTYGSLQRNSNVTQAQRNARARGRTDDEGFHTAAHQFFPGLEETILPGNRALNRGPWRVIENAVAQQTKEGNVVRGTITLRKLRAGRPAEFRISYKASDVSGEMIKEFDKIVKNETPE